MIDKLAFVINTFNEQVVDALNKNIDYDNLNRDIKTIDLMVDSDGIPTTQIQFQNALKTRIRGIEVMRAENLTSPGTYVTTAPFISFTENTKIITVQHVTGLQADNKYRLTVETIA